MTDKNVSDYISQQMTGEMFCTLFPNLSKKLVKLTNEDENHNGFKFHTGLNADFVFLEPKDECRKGGLYFTDMDNIARWLRYGVEKSMKYCRSVTLPPDCKVYIGENKFKADKFILGARVDISVLPVWSDEEYCLNAARKSTDSLKYINNINKNIQLESVKLSSHAIKHLLKRKVDISEEVQLAAVRKDGDVIKYLLDFNINVSREVQLEAVKDNWHVIGHLLDHEIEVTQEMQLEAIKHTWRSIKYLVNRKVEITKEVQLEAIRKNRRAVKFLTSHGIHVSQELRMEAAIFI